MFCRNENYLNECIRIMNNHNISDEIIFDLFLSRPPFFFLDVGSMYFELRGSPLQSLSANEHRLRIWNKCVVAGRDQGQRHV
jgi:hypothetical protein